MKTLWQKTIGQITLVTVDAKPSFSVAQLHQVHGNNIISVQDASPEKDGDGLFYQGPVPSLPLAIRTADCLPIWVLGQKGGALLHAGWRGIHQKIILGKEVQNIEPTQIIIGPHIKVCCFEIQQDFKQNFPTSAHFTLRNGLHYFDLQEEVRDQAKKYYPQAVFHEQHHCTHCQIQFHSHRRNKTKKRNWNLLLEGVLP